MYQARRRTFLCARLTSALQYILKSGQSDRAGGGRDAGGRRPAGSVLPPPSARHAWLALPDREPASERGEARERLRRMRLQKRPAPRLPGGRGRQRRPRDCRRPDGRLPPCGLVGDRRGSGGGSRPALRSGVASLHPECAKSPDYTHTRQGCSRGISRAPGSDIQARDFTVTVRGARRKRRRRTGPPQPGHCQQTRISEWVISLSHPAET